MESKAYRSEKLKKNRTGLLPHSFWKVGIVVMLLSIVPAIMVKVVGIEMAQAQKELLKVMCLNIFILGLLFIAWSKDKVEDEMTMSLRLKCMSFAFLWAILFVILQPFTSLLFKNYAEKGSMQGLVISMLIVYLLMYQLQKRGR